MNKRHLTQLLTSGALVVAICAGRAPDALAQGDFYKGKTITVIAGTTAGALYDQWARIIAAHMGKHIPGNPSMIVQNMPGAGHMIAANYLYNKSKPDGLTIIGSIVPSLYFDQLIGRKEAQYDWGKFAWIGSPVQGESQMYMRADTPYKTIEDVRNAKEPPRCGAQGTSDSAYFLPKLFEEVIGTKFHLVQGYPGGPEIDLAVERGEIYCRAFTIEAFMSREPYHTWRKKGFVRNIIQTGKKRDAKLPDTPTVWELMDRYKTPEASRRLASIMLAAGALGRPMIGAPGTPPDRVKILRDAFNKTMQDKEFLAELEKRKFELDPSSGEELEKIVKEALSQPPEVVARMKKILGE
ncbi:MAG TPA: tripartite tricarboxylate transporter substrate-binding protein [Candidatus Binatia bacterium]|nr:tripartite tricarboxylate transporter substrate-binding protein [Candidatus Binatia bacterium]